MIRYATTEDFDWIYKLYEENKFALGPCYTASLRKSLATNQMIVDDKKRGFCEFHLPIRTQHIAVYNICTAKQERKQGIANSLINFLEENYPYPIKAVCIPNTEAELFWSAVASFIGDKKTRKGKTLHVYYIDKNIKMKKEVLF